MGIAYVCKLSHKAVVFEQIGKVHQIPVRSANSNSHDSLGSDSETKLHIVHVWFHAPDGTRHTFEQSFPSRSFHAINENLDPGFGS